MGENRSDNGQRRYSLGCPVWACEHWRGSLFTAKAKRADWLGQYSSVFNAVEGNSTFYALPSVETARRWGESTAQGFEFCLKVPRVISHEKALQYCDDELRAWFAVLEALADTGRLGPSFLQLGPNFSPRELRALATFLSAWPACFPLAVEVRHRDWFDRGPHERQLDELLAAGGHDRVLFDSRALYATPPETPAEEISQTRKPRSPIRKTVIGRRPFVRFIGRDDVHQVQPWIDEWAETVAVWVRNGLRPLMFTHAPDDTFAPEFARRFHAAVEQRLPAEQGQPLTPFPGQCEPKPVEQLSLF